MVTFKSARCEHRPNDEFILIVTVEGQFIPDFRNPWVITFQGRDTLYRSVKNTFPLHIKYFTMDSQNERISYVQTDEICIAQTDKVSYLQTEICFNLNQTVMPGRFPRGVYPVTVAYMDAFMATELVILD